MTSSGSAISAQNGRLPKSTKKNGKSKKTKTPSEAQIDQASPSPTGRNKSPGVRFLHGRIYDSEFGKCCHQCRQKTRDFSVTCMNKSSDKQCNLHFCHVCLLNRYGENAEEVALLGDWNCPKCRGTCNCSQCMKKRGQQPTGVLVPIAKARGFASVAQMLRLGDNMEHCSEKMNKGAGDSLEMGSALSEDSETASAARSEEEHCKNDPKPQPKSKTSKVNTKISRRSSEKQDVEKGSKDYDALAVNSAKKCCIEQEERQYMDDNTLRQLHPSSSSTNCRRSARLCLNFDHMTQVDDASETGKSCQQCHAEITDSVQSCKNCTESEQSTFSLCLECLLDRYGEKVDEGMQLSEWKCSTCRGLCTSSPSTAIVTRSLSASKTLDGKDSKRGKRIIASKKEPISPTEEPAASTKYCRYENVKSDIKLETRPVKAVKFHNNNAVGIQKKGSDADILLPQSNELKEIASIEIPAEDLGHALQFLEFCEAFQEVLDLSQEQPEYILRELAWGQSKLRSRHSPVVQFHIQLLSMILEDSGEENIILSRTSSENGWLQPLKKCISESQFSFRELQLDNVGDYHNLDISTKLRILTFLCDEALGTINIRTYIDEENFKFVERGKVEMKEFQAEEKNLKRKLLDEVTRALLSRSGAPLSVSEHEEFVAKVKREADETLAGTMEAMKIGAKRKHRCHAVRSEPLFSDACGRKFWRLAGYLGKTDILLQEVAEWDSLISKERWFVYDVEQNETVERYISSMRNSQALEVKYLIEASALAEQSMKHDHYHYQQLPQLPTACPPL